MDRPGRRTTAPFALIVWMGLAVFVSSCGDRTENFQAVTVPDVNDPPLIVAQGPSWPSTAIDLSIQGPPSPYVIVADPDGLDDIALAVFSIQSAVLRRVIVRPDSMPYPPPSCTMVAWSDSVDITPMLPPTFAPLVERRAMDREGSMFTYHSFSWSPYSDGQAFPNIALASPYFGTPVNSCGPQYPLSRFGIYPPGVPAAFDVNVTFAEIEYQGISATVYDGAGHTATTSFPPLRLIYRMYGERRNPTAARVARAPLAFGRARLP
jgi:hypothetical protein